MSLPPEIMYQISDYLPDAEVARMRGTHRSQRQISDRINERRLQSRVSRGSLTPREFMRQLRVLIGTERYQSLSRLIEEELPAQVVNHSVSPVDLAVDLLDMAGTEDSSYWPNAVYDIWTVTRTARSTFINQVIHRVWESTNPHIQWIADAAQDRTSRSAQNISDSAQVISRKMTAVASLLFDEEHRARDQ